MMIVTETKNKAIVFKDIDIHLSLDELLNGIRSKNTSRKIIETAELCLKKTENIIRPKAVARWLAINEINREKVSFTDHNNNSIILDPGFSSRFLKGAKSALFSVYTIGSKLEKESAKASAKGHCLESYIYDIIGLLSLEKTRVFINKTAENKARESGWGVGSFLSPGSVHGWELTDQHSLCSALPLNEIDVEIRDDAILIPFKSISCLIAIGPEYKKNRVGSTCDVCSGSEHCQMKQI